MPDVVAPGERINSCSLDLWPANPKSLYSEESGTSMAAPHVSGLLATFLFVRREFHGRPDLIKRILLGTCMDLGSDRYYQGFGMPNLMQMLFPHDRRGKRGGMRGKRLNWHRGR